MREIEEVDGASVEEVRLVGHFPDARLDALESAARAVRGRTVEELHADARGADPTASSSPTGPPSSTATRVLAQAGEQAPSPDVLEALAAGTSASSLVAGGVTGPDDLAVAALTDHEARCCWAAPVIRCAVANAVSCWRSSGSPTAPGSCSGTTTGPVPEIATLRRDQIGDSSAVLTRAFDDDPVFRYLYPTARRRRWACRGFLQAIVRDGLPFGEVWAARRRRGDRRHVAGVAPGGRVPAVARRRAARAARGGVAGAAHRRTRSRDGLRYLTETEKLHPKEPHWYLAVDRRRARASGRRGWAGSCSTAVLGRLDEAGVPGYLETSTEGNVAWYRHHGFELPARGHGRPRRPVCTS